MRPLLSIYLLAPSKEKKRSSLLLQNKSPPTPKTIFRKKQGSPSSPIIELLLPSLGRWEFLQMSDIQSITT
jgi:hypothetical protein